MKPFYWILNGISMVITCFALLVLSLHFSLPALTTPMKQYADCTVISDSFLAYLILSAISTLLGLIAITIGGLSELEKVRVPYYCTLLTWAPFVLLLMWGGVLFSVGQLYWQAS